MCHPRAFSSDSARQKSYAGKSATTEHWSQVHSKPLSFSSKLIYFSIPRKRFNLSYSRGESSNFGFTPLRRCLDVPLGSFHDLVLQLPDLAPPIQIVCKELRLLLWRKRCEVGFDHVPRRVEKGVIQQQTFPPMRLCSSMRSLSSMTILAIATGCHTSKSSSSFSGR